VKKVKVQFEDTSISNASWFKTVVHIRLVHMLTPECIQLFSFLPSPQHCLI